jgi:nucleotide-binding universal stress UspA family protein
MHEILIPLDGTKAAETALPWAAYAARHSSATLHLLSVIPLESSGNGAIAAREEYLSDRQESLEAQGARVSIELVQGDPAQRIIARARRVDLTVMTSGTVRWIVSAVLDSALKDIEGPIVVVRTTPGEVSVPPEPRKILVPLDSTAYSGDVLPVVTHLATSLRASVVLCHVVHPTAGEAPPTVTGMRECVDDGNEFIARAAEYVAAAGVDVESIASTGEPARQIVRLAESCGAGLIAMATRGRDSLNRHVMGSVANRVLESTRTPCLLLRHDMSVRPEAEDADRISV